MLKKAVYRKAINLLPASKRFQDPEVPEKDRGKNQRVRRKVNKKVAELL